MIEIGYKRFPATFSVDLPVSKSIVARQLMLDYIHCNPLATRMESLRGCYLCYDLYDLSVALRALEHRRDKSPASPPVDLWCGKSATAYRFLLVLALFESSRVVLEHHPQLTRRIREEDFLPFRKVGADISFIPDRHITIINPNSSLSGVIDGSEWWRTSQFGSALLLTRPLHPSGLSFSIAEDIPSFDYIRLTERVINTYEVRSGSEVDWSAAAFWFQLMAMHPEIEEIYFPFLYSDSAQPDRKLTSIFKAFDLTFTRGDRLVRAVSSEPHEPLDVNLSQSLDLFPSVALTAFYHGRPFIISGISHLRMKESDRIRSVLDNLAPFGYTGVVVSEDTIQWGGQKNVPHGTFRSENGKIVFDSYGDHRIALAFGAFSTGFEGHSFIIEDEVAAKKSYPDFFSKLLSL